MMARNARKYLMEEELKGLFAAIESREHLGHPHPKAFDLNSTVGKRSKLWK